MDNFYTVFFIRKSDNKLLRRFDSHPKNNYLWKKEIEIQLNKVLNLYSDLDKKDVLVKEANGTNYNY